MCQCTPSIRTPYCGKGDCKWPERIVMPTTIAEAEAQYPDFKIESYPASRRSPFYGMTMYHVRHKPTGKETTSDSWTLDGAVWCCQHFNDEGVGDNPRFWVNPS